MKNIAMVLVSLFISTSVFAENREINDIRFSPAMNASALTPVKINTLKWNTEKFVEDCDKTNQIFEMSDAQHEVMPLNYHEAGLKEPQYSVIITVNGTCLDK